MCKERAIRRLPECVWRGVGDFRGLFMCNFATINGVGIFPDSEEGVLWDLWAQDWVQRRAECVRFCLGRYVTPAGQLPVSLDIEYEFSSRNPYNFLQVTYYKVSHILY